MNLHYGTNCKTQIKELLNKVEKLMNMNAENIQRQYIRCFPKNKEENIGMDQSFISTQMEFLSDTVKIMNKLVFTEGFVGAAKCYFSALEEEIIYEEPSHIANGISVLKSADGQTNYFFVLTDEFDFKAMYDTDETYFEYMTSGITIEKQRELAFTYLKYNRTTKKNIFIMINSEFDYKGEDFSAAGKKYIYQSIENVINDLGISHCIDFIEVYPYDFYFMKQRNNLPVQYFINRMETMYQKRSMVLSNIGRLLYTDAEDLIAAFAFASNNYVGTRYKSDKIKRIEMYYETLPKPQKMINPVDSNEEYTTLFKAIEEKASCNLYLLEDVELCKPLLTAEWLYNNVGDVEGFDNTFICFGYLKLVEILLSKILVEYYEGNKMSVNQNKEIVILSTNREKMMLGNMIRFITTSSKSELYHTRHLKQISYALSNWVSEIRNGYFHKHSMDWESVDSIRNKTFEIIYMILGTLPK